MTQQTGSGGYGDGRGRHPEEGLAAPGPEGSAGDRHEAGAEADRTAPRTAPEWERDREAGSRRRRDHRRRRGHRKERILHTRISRQLADEIRGMAEDLRVPVSNLVRNVLEEAFDVMEEVTDDVGDLLGEAIERAERATRRMGRRRGAGRDGAAEGQAAPPEAHPRGPEPGAPSLAETFPDVLAWQRVILNQPRRCARSGEELAAGSCAYLGFPAGGGPPIAISEWAFLTGTGAA